MRIDKSGTALAAIALTRRGLAATAPWTRGRDPLIGVAFMDLVAWVTSPCRQRQAKLIEQVAAATAP